MSMRLLGIDLGDKRTGIALADTGTGIASPLELIEVPFAQSGGSDLLAALSRIIETELGPDGGLVIMGLPMNMDGTEGPRAKMVRAFAARLEQKTGRKIVLHDERRSSVRADEHMARSGLTRGQKKARRDAIAAANILSSFLAQ